MCACVQRMTAGGDGVGNLDTRVLLVNRLLLGIGPPVGAGAVEGILVGDGRDLRGTLDELEREAEGSVPSNL